MLMIVYVLSDPFLVEGESQVIILLLIYFCNAIQVYLAFEDITI